MSHCPVCQADEAMWAARENAKATPGELVSDTLNLSLHPKGAERIIAEQAATIAAMKASGDWDIATWNEAVEACANVARSHEPQCESCPRGVENAILNLKRGQP